MLYDPSQLLLLMLMGLSALRQKFGRARDDQCLMGFLFTLIAPLGTTFIHSHWVYTMHRCATVCLALALLPSLCAAQAMQRTFTARALRGELLVTLPPEVRLNGELARLAPGARIKGVNNLLLMSGALVGQALLVNYTLDSYGLIHEVWLLSDEERTRQPWPSRREEAERWYFDAAAQSWTRR